MKKNPGSNNHPESAVDAVREVHALFLTHIDLIRGFIRALVRDHYLADDVLQETFLTVERKAESFDPGTNFPRWACSIARLKVLEIRRKHTGKLTFFSEEAIEALAKSEPVEEMDCRLDLMEKCIEELPASMKKMIKLRYLVERKAPEIARQVGWSLESVYVGLSRARLALRECIQAKLDSLEGGAR